MTEVFTVIFFNYNSYHDNKHRLDKIRNKYSVKWNDLKTIELNYEAILGIYSVFGYKDYIFNDNIVKGRKGISGIWETSDRTCAVKGIFFEKKNKEEHLPVLIVYKGIEGVFYEEFIRYCIGIGCTISKVIEKNGKFEEMFKKKKLDSQTIERFLRFEGTKDVMMEMFVDKTFQLMNVFSNSFIEEWKRLIEKHGLRSDKMLYNTIENEDINK